MLEKNFRRVEKKFWLDSNQYDQLMAFLADRVVVGDHGEYSVYNLYFDDDVYSLIRNSIRRPYFKEKLRLRCYGVPDGDSRVYLEIKRKLAGVGYKRREEMSFNRAMDLASLKATPQTQIEREICEFVQRYRVGPRVVLNYRRSSYRLREDSNFRITFDRDIKYAMYSDVTSFLGVDSLVMGDGDRVLLEIKTEGALPLWFSNKLSELKIYQAPFSKIGAVYLGHIREV